MRRALLICLVACGCSREEPIREYTVPKEAKPGDAAYRILGGIFPAEFPAEQSAWFFKASGRADALAPYAQEIETFLASIRFQNGGQNAPVWTLPPGWQ